MTKILISACLYGDFCKYDGGMNYFDRIDLLKRKATLIPVCPEVLGGLSTPRTPAEILGDKVINSDGKDVTAEYKKGAEIALETALKNDCKIALMKAKSPSCGSGKVYDGTFSKALVDGDGIAVKRLRDDGIQVYSENQFEELIAYLDEVEK